MILIVMCFKRFLYRVLMNNFNKQNFRILLKIISRNDKHWLDEKI